MQDKAGFVGYFSILLIDEQSCILEITPSLHPEISNKIVFVFHFKDTMALLYILQ